jgi:hypothetical protein
MKRRLGSCLAAFSALLFACSDSAGPKANAASSSVDAGLDGPAFTSGTELRVSVPETGRAFVKLSPPSVVTVADPKASPEWDLAFEGLDVFTNSGPSGSGQGASFGPLDAITFIGDAAPQVPFLSPDKTGGAFVDWYKYEGAPSHALWSRYHVFGVKDGARLWKVQILTYYGQRDGASISGLYKIRYAEITGGTASAVQEVNLDATAGGAQAAPTTPSECIDLGSGARTMLTPEAARTSNAWHLCFRRQTISVNGELGGPRGVGAVDLEADKVAAETIDALKALTGDTERARFDAVTAASFDGKTFRGDRVISGFGDSWMNTKVSPIEPAYSAWLVVSASGKEKFLVGFSSFESPTTKSPGTVVMRVKPVKG